MPSSGYHSNQIGSERLLIIHGDDLGMSHSVNEATFLALEEGAITSASVMPTCPWLPEVADYVTARPSSDLGLHLTLTCEGHLFRWGAMSTSASQNGLLDHNGYLHMSL